MELQWIKVIKAGKNYHTIGRKQQITYIIKDKIDHRKEYDTKLRRKVMFKVSLDTDKKVTLLIILFLVEWVLDKLVMLGMFFLFRWIEIVRKIFWSGGEGVVRLKSHKRLL